MSLTYNEITDFDDKVFEFINLGEGFVNMVYSVRANMRTVLEVLGVDFSTDTEGTKGALLDAMVFVAKTKPQTESAMQTSLNNLWNEYEGSPTPALTFQY